MKRSMLSRSIQGVLGLAALSAMPTTFAQDKEIVEEVYVTGSRIPIAVSDTPRPVISIDIADIKAKGVTDVATALRESTFNTLGSFRDRSGSSFGQVALVNLKGIGEDRTLVLVNGRRIGGNPLTGTSAVDLNTIPFAAVERIEVLTDSASAVYGADAIGGVVNIITKKEFDGLELTIGTDQPEVDDATTDRFELTFGQSGEKGNVVVAVDYFKRNPIFDADRDYSRVVVNEPADGSLPVHTIDTVGVSSGGNTGFTTDFSDAFQVGFCDPEIYVPLANPEGIPGGEGCGFGYADISLQTGGIERTSVLLNGDYSINDDHELYFENRLTYSETFGRFAPAVGFVLVGADAPLNPVGEDFFLFHRFVGHGNRDDNVAIAELDNLIGLKGSLFGGAVNYDVFAKRYLYDATEEGDTYVLTAEIEAAILDGSYNFVNPLDPSNAGAIASTSATLTRDLRTEYTNAGFALDGTFASLPGGKIGWAFGGDYAEEEYQDQYDNQREANNITGSAGNSAEGDRTRYSFFGEAGLPLLDNLYFTVAGRFDDFSDFGSEFSPSLAVKWDIIDQLAIRSSWGEGFKAPNLNDLHSVPAFSAEGVTDTTFCNANGITECPSTQQDETTGGNPELLAEESESFNFGVIFTPSDSLSVSLDYWSVEIESAIDQLDVADVLDLEQRGQLPSGVIVNRAPPAAGNSVGAITRCVGGLLPPNCGIINVFGNFAGFEVEGLDLKAQYDFGTSFGDFVTSLSVSHYLTYDETPSPLSDTLDRPGTADFPETQAAGTVNWSYGPVNTVYSFQWIDSHEGGTSLESYDSYTKHDINFIFDTGTPVELQFGIRNFTDEEPVISSVSGYTADTQDTTQALYDLAGRTYTFSATLRL